MLILTKKEVKIMCKNGCCCALQIVISLIVAAIVGILRFFGFFYGPEPIWAIFLFGILALALLIAYTFTSLCNSCCQKGSTCGKILLVIGALGTVITSIIALATLDARILVIAIISAFVAFFAALLITGIIINLLRVSNESCKCRM